MALGIHSSVGRIDLFKKQTTNHIQQGFPGGLAIKNPPSMQEVKVQSLGQEDSLEKEMASHSSILAWEIPWAEEPDRLQSMGLQSRTRLSK